MSDQTPKQVHDKMNKKWNRAVFKKAVISVVNTNNFTADVFFAENPQTVVKSVPLASTIVPFTVNAGDRCRVDIFDETNPSDMVVAYIYGRRVQYPLYASGTGLMSWGASNTMVIPHGLPGTPQVYASYLTAYPYYTGHTYVTTTYVDATNITINRIPDNSITVQFYWYAVLF
jgi:hypothetical protein